jgi:hypothetical protein
MPGCHPSVLPRQRGGGPKAAANVRGFTDRPVELAHSHVMRKSLGAMGGDDHDLEESAVA